HRAPRLARIRRRKLQGALRSNRAGAGHAGESRMSYYFKLGQLPHKRHTQFRKPDGSLYHEELIGIQGFTGDKSLLYHLRPPTAVDRIEQGCPIEIPFADQGPLRHRLLRTAQFAPNGDAVTGRVPLMANSDLCISIARPNQ